MTKIERKCTRNPLTGDEEVYFLNRKTEQEYRRIIGGFTWPGTKPAFSVVLAEDRKKDDSINGRCLRVLAESEENDIGQLFQTLLSFREDYQVPAWYGDPQNSPMMELFYHLNEGQRQKEKPPLYPVPAPQVDDPRALAFYAATIKKQLHQERKLLHFEKSSKLPGHLMELAPGALDKQASEYPAIAALGYAVSTMVLWPSVGQIPGARDDDQLAYLDPLTEY